MDHLINKNIKIDTIITDPPYGTTECKWDSVIPIEQMWDKIHSLTIPESAIVLFGNEPFSSMIRTSNLKEYKYDWKWEKTSGANFLNFKYQPAKVHEDIMVFSQKATAFSKKGTMNYYPQMTEGKPYAQKQGLQKNIEGNPSMRTIFNPVFTINKGERYPRSIQKFKHDKEKLHQTQKPLALMEFLVKTYTKESDLVLDFTMGSGTTAIACINTNRNFIGIELDDKYFEVAKDRINKHIEDNSRKDDVCVQLF